MSSEPLDLLVVGNLNVETRVAVGPFPVAYEKVRFVRHGIEDRVAGVGYNVAASGVRLGLRAGLAARVGPDVAGRRAREQAAAEGLDVEGIVEGLAASARSVVLAGEEGREAIFTDLKDQDACTYPLDRARPLIARSRHVHLGNVAWALPLGVLAREMGKPISTDVQNIRTLDDAYNLPFLELADIAFLSTENLEQGPEALLPALWRDYDLDLVVCGEGARGALLGIRAGGEVLRRAPPVRGSPVRRGTGGGDALVAGFLAALLRGATPAGALEAAQAWCAAWLRA